MKKLETFNFNGNNLKTRFEERSEVVAGVVCDVYSHPENSAQDLGVIIIQPGMKTPLQKVLRGDKTIEGYISGKGKLTITHVNGDVSTFEVFPEKKDFAYEVLVGELMQWQAASDSILEVFEVCFPPYQDGRFQNIEE